MPRWRRDSQELFYISEDYTLMAAEVQASQKEFNVKSVRPLFRVNYAPEASASGGSYDVSADGTRFLMNVNSDDTPSPISIVLNWTDALTKK